MKPTIVDADTGHELWTAAECADYAGTSRGTFTSYAGRGRAPTPAAKLHGLTLWDAREVKEWQASRNHRPPESGTPESGTPESGTPESGAPGTSGTTDA